VSATADGRGRRSRLTGGATESKYERRELVQIGRALEGDLVPTERTLVGFDRREQGLAL